MCTGSSDTNAKCEEEENGKKKNERKTVVSLIIAVMLICICLYVCERHMLGPQRARTHKHPEQKKKNAAAELNQLEFEFIFLWQPLRFYCSLTRTICERLANNHVCSENLQMQQRQYN